MLNPEDDIEDIYKQFAEHYPLNPGDASWDELQARMAGEKPVTSTRPVAIKKYWYVLAALLVFIIATLGLHLNSWQSTTSPTQKIAAKKPNSSSPLKTLPADTFATRVVRPRDSISKATNRQELKPGIQHNNAVADVKVNNRQPFLALKPSMNLATTANLSLTPGTARDLYGYSAKDETNGVIILPMKGELVSILGFKNMYGNYNPAAWQGMPGRLPGEGGEAAAKKISIPTVGFKKRLYVSLVLGPDVSTVKFQGGSNAGISIGVMAGIKLSKKISLETGLLVDKKNYFSSGQYFDKTTAGITDPDDHVSSVNGIGNFVEVPVIVRMNVINSRKGAVFVAAGLSSYITQRERYNLSIERPAGQERRDMDDDDWRVNMLSVVHLSAGYEYKLNARSALQLEPYFKLPFSGIGHAALPITSTGLYFRYIINIGK
ncbi:MAG TPA: hypothetical protein VIM77_06355 [Mucilaginibacter sp.]